MEPDANKAKIVEMLIQFRDSLTEMSLMLKDYQSNLDTISHGPATRESVQSLSVWSGRVGTARNEHSV